MTHQLKLSRAWPLVSLVSVLAAACSSGGGGGGSQATNPTVSLIAAQSINQDTPVGPIPFSVSMGPGTTG